MNENITVTDKVVCVLSLIIRRTPEGLVLDSMTGFKLWAIESIYKILGHYATELGDPTIDQKEWVDNFIGRGGGMLKTVVVGHIATLGPPERDLLYTLPVWLGDEGDMLQPYQRYENTDFVLADALKLRVRGRNEQGKVCYLPNPVTLENKPM